MTRNIVYLGADLWQHRAMDHPGEVTKKWRKEAKLTIPDLAALAKIDKGTISRFERSGDFRRRVFEAICGALGKTPRDAYAVLGEVTPKPAPVAAWACPDPDHHRLYEAMENALHEGVPPKAIEQGFEILRLTAGLAPLPEGEHRAGSDEPGLYSRKRKLR